MNSWCENLELLNKSRTKLNWIRTKEEERLQKILDLLFERLNIKRYVSWDCVSGIKGLMNEEVKFRNPVSSKVGFNPTCPSIGDARNMKPGETCITYESLGSRAVSGNACANKGFNTWLLIVSKLPNDEFYFNCAGKIW